MSDECENCGENCLECQCSNRLKCSKCKRRILNSEIYGDWYYCIWCKEELTLPSKIKEMLSFKKKVDNDRRNKASNGATP